MENKYETQQITTSNQNFLSGSSRVRSHSADWSLPVFSVTTMKEANQLIVMTCPTTIEGKHYARELAQEQTLDNLYAFSDKLEAAHDILVERGLCKCGNKKKQ